MVEREMRKKEFYFHLCMTPYPCGAASGCGHASAQFFNLFDLTLRGAKGISQLEALRNG